jgi:hypothetical protein
MAICVSVVPTAVAGPASVGDGSGVVYQSIFIPSTESIDTCTGYVMLSGTEYLNYTALTGFFNISSFDPVIFSEIVGFVLVAYILGHTVGAVIKVMGFT